MENIVWGKDNCPYCSAAKALLEKEGIQFEYRNTSGDDWSTEDMKAMAPNANSYPQIFLENEYIGGFNDLDRHIEFKKLMGM